MSDNLDELEALITDNDTLTREFSQRIKLYMMEAESNIEASSHGESYSNELNELGDMFGLNGGDITEFAKNNPELLLRRLVLMWGALSTVLFSTMVANNKVIVTALKREFGQS